MPLCAVCKQEKSMILMATKELCLSCRKAQKESTFHKVEEPKPQEVAYDNYNDYDEYDHELHDPDYVDNRELFSDEYIESNSHEVAEEYMNEKLAEIARQKQEMYNEEKSATKKKNSNGDEHIPRSKPHYERRGGKY
jgi:hypothetical protein